MNEAEVVDVALGILIEVQSTVFYFCKFYLCIYFGRAGSSLLHVNLLWLWPAGDPF